MSIYQKEKDQKIVIATICLPWPSWFFLKNISSDRDQWRYFMQIMSRARVAKRYSQIDLSLRVWSLERFEYFFLSGRRNDSKHKLGVWLMNRGELFGYYCSKVVKFFSPCLNGRAQHSQQLMYNMFTVLREVFV